jgi:hypothetical protein
MAHSVTIDGKVIGKLTAEFETLASAIEYVEAWCIQRNRSINVTFSMGPVPDWGLPTGGTYRLACGADGTEAWHDFELLSEG